MTDLLLTDQQLAMQKAAKDFVEAEIKPIAMDMDAKTDPAQAFPTDAYMKGFELGIHKMVIPKKYGGMELDAKTMYLIEEELGAGDAGFAVSWLSHVAGLHFFINDATETQLGAVLTPFAKGNGGFFALADLEPDVGSTWAMVSDEIVKKTTAVLSGDHWVINGKKSWCTNADTPLTKWYLISARTDMDKLGIESTSTFLIPADSPGLKFGRPEDKAGLRLSQQCEVYLNDVSVPKEYLIGGKPGQIPNVFERKCRVDNFLLFSSMCIGLARSAFESALEFAKKRIILGKPEIQLQIVAGKLADMDMSIRSARTFAWQVACNADEYPHWDVKSAMQNKILSSDMAVKVANDAMMLWGAGGYTKHTLVEKLHRDAMLCQTADGANDLLRDAVSRWL